MKSYQKILALVLALDLSQSLAACAAKTETAASTETASTETASDETASDAVESKGTITVAASPTPHAEILEQAKSILAEEGCDLSALLPALTNSDSFRRAYKRARGISPSQYKENPGEGGAVR